MHVQECVRHIFFRLDEYIVCINNSAKATNTSRMERKLSTGVGGFYFYCVSHKEETCRDEKI